MEEKGRKAGDGSRPATILWPTDHAWPALNPYFHPPLHLAPIMPTFPNSFYLFLKFLDFILCSDEINMLWKSSK
jgi:hypothetical protein